MPFMQMMILRKCGALRENPVSFGEPRFYYQQVVVPKTSRVKVC